MTPKPTPRTDEEAGRFPQPGQPPGIQWPEIVPADFARQLERELAREKQRAEENGILAHDTAIALATAREALEWARGELGKHTRPSPIDKALGLRP